MTTDMKVKAVADTDPDLAPQLYELTYTRDGVAGKSRRYTVLAVSIEDALLQCRGLLADGNGANGWTFAEARCLTAARRVYVTDTAIRSFRGIPNLPLLIDCIERRLKQSRGPEVSAQLHETLDALRSLGGGA